MAAECDAAILVSGSRDWTRERLPLIRRALTEAWRELGSPPSVLLVHGDCRGVDRLSAEAARELGWALRAVPAKWENGRGAGPIRNSAMVAMCKDLGVPVGCLAFHDDLAASRGTRDCHRKMEAAARSSSLFRFVRVVRVHTGL